MQTLTTGYSGASAAPTVITMSLSNLAASGTLVAGRESNEVDNTTTKYVDAMVYGRFSVGSSPLATAHVFTYLWGQDVSLAVSPINALDGVDSAETFTNTTELESSLILARATPILVTTANLQYDIVPFSVARHFNGVMPLFWGLFVMHNNSSALRSNAVNVNQFRFHGITYDQT